mmetsp:Transcript_7070/g.20655  ORF Transcript_7070/g.20655 Transcript_7070/m.20655 type:complete len:214 (-) Transcript_7070:275-916(-)
MAPASATHPSRFPMSPLPAPLPLLSPPPLPPAAAPLPLLLLPLVPPPRRRRVPPLVGDLLSPPAAASAAAAAAATPFGDTGRAALLPGLPPPFRGELARLRLLLVPPPLPLVPPLLELAPLGLVLRVGDGRFSDGRFSDVRVGDGRFSDAARCEVRRVATLAGVGMGSSRGRLRAQRSAWLSMVLCKKGWKSGVESLRVKNMGGCSPGSQTGP